MPAICPIPHPQERQPGEKRHAEAAERGDNEAAAENLGEEGKEEEENELARHGDGVPQRGVAEAVAPPPALEDGGVVGDVDEEREETEEDYARIVEALLLEEEPQDPHEADRAAAREHGQGAGSSDEWRR